MQEILSHDASTARLFVEPNHLQFSQDARGKATILAIPWDSHICKEI
jgi:hypothetical protein